MSRPCFGAGRSLLAAACVLFCSRTFAAGSDEQLSAQTIVEKREVFVGEPFAMRIQVSGSNKPEKPDVSRIGGFSVEQAGEQENSQQSLAMDMRGNVTRVVRLGYTFNYRLTAQKDGVLTIPSIPVKADGREFRTAPVQITVQKPMEAEHFRLRQELSKAECYVGEPVLLTVTLYVGQETQLGEFRLAALAREDDFFFADARPEQTPGARPARVAVNGKESAAEQGTGQLEGKEWVTLRFRKVLIPRKPGTFDIEPATVVCDAVVGYRKRQSPFGSMFDDDFFRSPFGNDFMSGREKVLKRTVVGSNELKLRALAVPVEGRPANFAGHVGEYRVEASAAPTEVNVGDPITLRIAVSGPEYLEHVTLPSLQNQPALARDFKIPGEMAPGAVEDSAKVFTQTVRALRADVTGIPAIDLPYFDTAAREYRVARSKPIPLKVRSTRVLTARDAEGAPSADMGAALEDWTKGIAYNYEDLSVIEDQGFGPEAWLRSPGWAVTMGAPPAGYLALLAVVLLVRRRAADPLAARSRRAHSAFRRKMRGVAGRGGAAREYEAVLEALRGYLGDKLRMPPDALTFNDVRDPLKERGVSDAALESLGRLFAECEAGRYAGLGRDADPNALIDRSMKLADGMEKAMGKH